jgi:hypothetical protein
LISVTPEFNTAEYADSAEPAFQVNLVFGNYAPSSVSGTTISSSGDDPSGNYPASGAIDGDRTEINIGAPAGADNGVGLSSWRSSFTPSRSQPAALTLEWANLITFTRIKIYNLAADPLTSYLIQYFDPNQQVWVPLCGTSDNITPPGNNPSYAWGYGPYDNSQSSIPYGGMPGGAGSWPEGGYTGGVDIYDFPPVSTMFLQLLVYSTTNNDAANVVEWEIYNVVDITDRVMGYKIDRKKDFKLANPIATQLDVTLDNSDQFFSFPYQPTAAQIAAGYVNSAMANLGFNIELNEGFYTTSGIELIRTFTGSVDSLEVKAKSATAEIQARDYMKRLINHEDSSGLKTQIDIANCIQYLLNRLNVSNFEMNLQLTTIVLSYFFIFETQVMTAIQDLVQAAGDAIFYFDELGHAIFEFYLGSTPNGMQFGQESVWESGVELQNISTTGPYVDTIATPPQLLPSYGQGTTSGQMINGGYGLTLPGGSSYNGGSDAQSNPAENQINFLNVGNGATPSGVAEPFDVPLPGYIQSVTVQLDPGNGSSVPNGCVVYGNTNGIYGSIPDLNNVIAIATFNQVSGSIYKATMNVHIPAERIWLSVQMGGLVGNPYTSYSFTNQGRAWDTYTPANEIYPLMDLGNNSLGLTSSFTFAYDIVAENGEWDLPYQDTGINPKVAEIGSPLDVFVQFQSYPAGTTTTIYVDGSDDGATAAVTYTITQPPTGHTYITPSNHRYWRYRVVLSTQNNTQVPTLSIPTMQFDNSMGTWISPIIDQGITVSSEGVITLESLTPPGTIISVYTRTSPDQVNWTAWVGLGTNYQIESPVQRYIEVQIVLVTGNNTTPQVFQISVGWSNGNQTTKWSTSIDFTFTDDNANEDIDLTISDNLGGDTAIINDVAVTSSPLYLQGTSTDVTWQGTTGTPPAAISPTNPLPVAVGQLVFNVIIDGGMDTSQMANGLCIQLTFANGGAGLGAITYVHPTKPVLTITVTTAGTITNLQLTGLSFSSANTPYQATASDVASIILNNKRHSDIENDYIISNGIAGIIATRTIANFKNPTTYIQALELATPKPNMQPGDQIQIQNAITGLESNYYVIGMSRSISISQKGATKKHTVILLPVPNT